jgi:hypothetical protein
LICKIIPVSKNWNMIPGMVVHIFNPSTPEAEARDLGASLGYIAKPVSKKKKKVCVGASTALVPVIPATWEAEIGRIMVQSQSR